MRSTRRSSRKARRSTSIPRRPSCSTTSSSTRRSPRTTSRSCCATTRATTRSSTSCRTRTPGSAATGTARTSSRSPSGRRRRRSPDPLALLGLPDRRAGLDLVDDLARARERLAAVRRRHGHDDRRLAQRHAPDAVLGGRGAQAVALDRGGDDRLHLLARHLRVGLVVEPLGLARDALEHDDGARARVAHARGDGVERQRLGADRDVRRGRRPAAHGRDQGELVAGREHVVGGRVLAVDRHHEPEPAGEVVDRGEGVADGGALGQLELDAPASGALAQDGEQADRDGHRGSGPWGAGRHGLQRNLPPMATEERLTVAPIVGPEDPRRFTDSGIEVKPVYTDADLPADLSERLGAPGEEPYTRGVHADMYRKQLWTMRQYAGYASAKESNERYRYLLSKGSTGLSMAFDLPTQLGLDSDNPRCLGEVGRTGVAIDTIEDMRIAFDQIPLDQVSTSMTINAPAAVLLLLYELVAEEQGVAADKLRGTTQNDVLKEYIARGNYIYPPQPTMRLTTDLFAYCAQRIPKWNTVSISGYHFREKGASAVQEVAFTLCSGIAYVQAALDAGLEVDQFAPRLAFFFNCHNNVFQEVAKFRAARRMWAHIMRARFGATDPRSLKLRFHTQTGGVTLTAQQPENNIVRVALQAFA